MGLRHYTVLHISLKDSENHAAVLPHNVHIPKLLSVAFQRIGAALSLGLLASGSLVHAADLFDLAAAGRMTSWTGSEIKRLTSIEQAKGLRDLGFEWDEERDIQEIRVAYSGAAPRGATVEYWFRNWPYEPPKMPSFEDPMDDPWQGKWLKAAVSESCADAACRYTFEPLTQAENEKSKNLPGVLYRRTLKVRVVYTQLVQEIRSMQVYSGSEEIPLQVRVELALGDVPAAGWTVSASAYNGRITSTSPWQFGAADKATGRKSWSFHPGDSPKGLLLDMAAAKPNLPGSHDATVVTIHAKRKDAAGETNRSFSFATDDLRAGPIELPAMQARVVGVSSPGNSARPKNTQTRVRQRIPLEPEQTYERARREIPPLDPWNREGGERVYLPLAPDSSWQKFAFEYGGDVFVSKTGIKAKGRELQRLGWEGDKITWRIGTGATPYYREDHQVIVRKLDDYLPIVTQTWKRDGVQYSEEAYATLLRGELAPENQGRDEETPAILMLKLSARNESASASHGDVWISADAAGTLTVNGKAVSGNGKLAAYLAAVDGEQVAAADIPGSGPPARGIHVSFDLPARGEHSVVLKIPCVSDLTAADAADLDRLDYAAERARTIAYWKKIVGDASRFTVPEPKFNLLAKSVVAQIHISTTKDPKTGLYMVPAASYGYDVFENESCYQVLLLDTLGQFDTAAQYLETLMRLQGSKNFPGMQTGSFDGVFHGAKINDTYDYTAHGYGLDHGTVLWTLAQHYFYSRDRQWLEHARPHLQRAIDWIEKQRSATKLTEPDGSRVREYGLLPASQLEDNADWAHWFSINAFAWAGMQRTAEALKEIGNPEGEKIQQQAEAFRSDLRAAILRAVENAPVVRMQDGTYQPYVPVLPTRRFRLFGPIRADYYARYGHPEMKPLMRLGADRDTLCGAVVLLLLGVFSPDEPIADWILNDWEDNETLSSGMGLNIHGMTEDRYWFSQGGMVFQANLVNPIQTYLLRHEAPAAIRNLYNDFVACLYPEVNIFTEEFHQWHHGSGPFYKISDEARFANRVRDALVFEDKDTLWLAPGVPRRWLASKEGISVRDVQTFFGPVSYSLHAAEKAAVVEGTIELSTRTPAKKAWLVARVPQGKIASVKINGTSWTRIDRRSEAIELPQNRGRLQVEIRYR